VFYVITGHRKDAPSGSPFKKHHKSHKYKHRKDKADGKDKENESKTKEESLKVKEQKKRPRSATFNATAVLAMMPLQEISEQKLMPLQSSTTFL